MPFDINSMTDDELVAYVGLHKEGGQAAALDTASLRRIITVKLAAAGFDVKAPPSTSTKKSQSSEDLLNVTADLFRVYREQSRLLESHLCPVDQRIQNFLNDALANCGETVNLPTRTVAVDRYGLARELSFPDDADEFFNSEISSYRLSKGGTCIYIYIYLYLKIGFSFNELVVLFVLLTTYNLQRLPNVPTDLHQQIH